MAGRSGDRLRGFGVTDRPANRADSAIAQAVPSHRSIPARPAGALVGACSRRPTAARQRLLKSLTTTGRRARDLVHRLHRGQHHRGKGPGANPLRPVAQEGDRSSRAMSSANPLPVVSRQIASPATRKAGRKPFAALAAGSTDLKARPAGRIIIDDGAARAFQQTRASCARHDPDRRRS